MYEKEYNEKELNMMEMLKGKKVKIVFKDDDQSKAIKGTVVDINDTLILIKGTMRGDLWYISIKSIISIREDVE